MKDARLRPPPNDADSVSKGLLSASLLVFLCGAAYYLAFRHSATSPAIWAQNILQWLPAHHMHWLAELTANNNIQDWTAGTFPSFVHMLSLSLLSFGALGYINGARLTLTVLAITIIAEFSIGTTDPNDIFAALLGTTIAIVAASQVFTAHKGAHSTRASNKGHHHKKPKPLYNALSSIGILLCSSYFITGTSCVTPECDGDGGIVAKPVYMDYPTLRSAVAVEAPKEVGEVKRVYLYQQYIFLNRKNEGIHVIDNSDPANPDNIQFINIPGNTELAIRDNYLYADSYIDLVTLSLNDLQNIQEVARQEEVFPWDERQNIPDNIYFDYFDIDRNRGVVVSYETQ